MRIRCRTSARKPAFGANDTEEKLPLAVPCPGPSNLTQDGRKPWPRYGNGLPLQRRHG